MPVPCVIANWKMHGSLTTIETLLVDIAAGMPWMPAAPSASAIEIVICPPSIYLQEVRNILQKHAALQSIQLGAQNVYCESKGAFTGEISPEMLVDVGCQYVIIGHSERRQGFLEEDALIARKWVASYHAGLTPVLCVGETKSERDQGKTFDVVRRQLQAVLEQVDVQWFSKGCLAYEPVWAIGTGLTAVPEQAEEVHHFLRNCLAEQSQEAAEETRILYGGSVNASNADALLAKPNVNGALIGGASLAASEFLSICNSAIARV